MSYELRATNYELRTTNHELRTTRSACELRVRRPLRRYRPMTHSTDDGGPLVPIVRKGQGSVKLSREEFARRLGERFYDPVFDSVRDEIARITEVAWTTYDEYHKS